MILFLKTHLKEGEAGPQCLPYVLVRATPNYVVVQNPLQQNEPMTANWLDVHPLNRFALDFYDAWNRGDMVGVCMRIHPDFVGDLDLGDTMVHTHGRQGFIDDRDRSARSLKDVKIDLLDMTFTAPDKIEVHTRITGTQLGPYNGIGGPGDLFLAYAIGAWTVRNQLIERNRERMIVLSSPTF